MGSGRDKRKKSKPKAPGAGADKTERKTAKNEEKTQRRVETKLKGGEDDIDAMLAAFKLQEEKANETVIIDNADPPSARVHSSFTPGPPQRAGDMLLYGGEYYDSTKDKIYVYADLFIYHTDKNSWTQIEPPKGPLPRSAHQAVLMKGCVYVFGGEFTSPNQEKFKHYNDLWRLDIVSWKWEQLPSRGGPSARSGHRMVAYKGKLLLFGGFYDAGREPKYYNDLWEYDIEELKWTAVGSPDAPRPPPRGGCQLVLYNDMMYMFGGYSVKPVDGDEDGKGVIHEDMWVLDIKTHTWEKVKKAGMAPGKRASFALVSHKNRALLFGGVSDQDGKGDKMYSELHNELYQFNLDSRRWFPVALRGRKKGTGGATAGPSTDGPQATAEEPGSSSSTPTTDGGAEASSSSSGAEHMHQVLQNHAADKNSPLYRAAVRIQSRYRGYVIRKAYKTYKLGGKVSELLYSPATYGIDMSALDTPKPRARTNPHMAVIKNKLWLFGGIVEVARTDVTLDDIWTLDLVKLDCWHCVQENTAGEEAFKGMEFSDEEGWETDES